MSQLFGYRSHAMSFPGHNRTVPQEYVIETTITVGNTDWKGSYNRGWDGAWDQGAGGGGIGSIADDSIPDNRDDIERAYVEGHNETFHFVVWSSAASGSGLAAYTAWTFIEIVNDSTITRYERANASASSLTSSNGAGARLFNWTSPSSGAGLNTDGASTVVMGAASNTVTFRVANNE